MKKITEQTRQESNLKVDRNTRYKEIIEKLYEYEEGLTAREITYKLGYTERNAVAPRLTELCNNAKSVPEKYKNMVVVCGKKYDNTTKTNVSVYKIKKENNVKNIVQGNVNFGYKMKCENCKYGIEEKTGKKVVAYYCKKLKGSITIEQYKRKSICNLFEKA